MGKISSGTFKTDEESEEASELLSGQEAEEKKNCIRFRISPALSIKRTGEQAGRKVGLVGQETADKIKIRARAEHSLFSEGRVADNYDVEAVKLGHARAAWHEVGEDKRLSISSEESVSDYEQVRMVMIEIFSNYDKTLNI